MTPLAGPWRHGATTGGGNVPENQEEGEDSAMNDPRMPTTLPSPVDRGAFRFVAVDADGTEWLWMDRELVWVRLEKEPGHEDTEAGPCDVLH